MQLFQKFFLLVVFLYVMGCSSTGNLGMVIKSSADHHTGVKDASPDSQDKIEGLVACLVSEIINFVRVHPDTPPAGLYLDVSVLLPVWMKKEGDVPEWLQDKTE